jgi:alkanesulfonate monooxygenase SsuD/methylene tetrahydromethanopterin reductase-like flavin-dependent oxidoreductase (luciferase family)
MIMPKEKIDKRLGYWASQEQYAMQDLLKFVIEAEKYGFDSCLTSDHFHPWFMIMDMATLLGFG